MNRDRRHFFVGLFVLSGVALLALAIIVLGGQNLGRSPVLLETVFEESVQGLDVGAPLKFRGVKIGEVAAIGFVDEYYAFADPVDREFAAERILVRMKLTDPAQTGISDEERRERMESRIERGLRVQLTAAGLTGTTFVQADVLDPESYPPPEIRWEPRVLYVPSATSLIGQFVSQAERLLDRVESLNIETMLTDLDRLIVVLADGVEALDLEEIQASLMSVLDGANEAVEELRTQVAAADLRGVGGSAQSVLDEATTAIRKVESSIDGGRYDLELSLENLRVASENLRDLTQTLNEQPSLLLRSGAPLPVEGP
ncbi:MAG: MlaD family protein [Myxococcota bacterium]|nr:MlaD family protein [Myxococcota bacterium]